MLNSQRSLLEFQIHLINGHNTVVILTNPTDVNAAITHFGEPERLFAHQDLIIGHDHATSVFRREHITWIDIVGDALPQWPLPLGAQAIDEIEEQQYRARFGQNGSSVPLAGGNPSAIEIEFINGKRLYWQVVRQPVEMVSVDIVSLEHNMFKSGGLHARRSGGGVVIINPANVSRYTFVPGMPQLPLNALHGAHAEVR